jgi:hypothetical protein
MIVRSTDGILGVVWCSGLKTKAVKGSGTLVSAYQAAPKRNSEVSRVMKRFFGYHFVFEVFGM